jgi:hypothetical protein
MSSATIAVDSRVDQSANAGPSLARLTAVELRKMVDTRAGFWLQLAVLGLMITFAVLSAVLGPAADHNIRDILEAVIFPLYVLLPVVGILLVTSEWTQRTTLITFTLVPRRSRVLAAKLFAGVVTALVAFVASIALTLPATALADPGLPRTWSLPATMMGQEALLVVVAMIMGLGFGAVVLSTAPAIVFFFLLPLGWAALGSIPAVSGTAEWLDSGRSFAPVTEHVMSAVEWARAGTSLALWVVLPVLVGIWRIHRSELS